MADNTREGIPTDLFSYAKLIKKNCLAIINERFLTHRCYNTKKIAVFSKFFIKFAQFKLNILIKWENFLQILKNSQ